MRLLICGDRHWTDYALVKSEIEDFDAHMDIVEVIIEGGANGADFCAKLAAFQLDIPVEEYPAHWDEQGRKAGPLRNKKMLDEGKPDFVLAFHDDFENSKGTKNMVDAAIKAKIPHAIIKHDKDWNPQITVIDPPAPKAKPIYPTPRPAPYPMVPYQPVTPYQPYPGTPKPWRREDGQWQSTKKYYYKAGGTWGAIEEHPAISLSDNPIQPEI